jgi:osmotically-inducible protein OsmY
MQDGTVAGRCFPRPTHTDLHKEISTDDEIEIQDLEAYEIRECRWQRQFLTEVSCDCRDGILYLRGHTHSSYQKQLAQEVVRRLDGIETVVNEIEVDS